MSRLARLGFDPGKLRFAARTAIAACLALALAWALGLEHPQWAGMSVWAASQPLRGQLLEKSFFRFTGTVSGTIAGVVLVQAGQIHPALLVAGLALWVALCTGIGNLQRGFVAYGTVLAGYTAAMVSLLDAAHPENVVHLGLDRLATVLTGVVVATLAGFFFAQGGAARAALRAPVRALLADILAALSRPAPAEAAALLGRLAALEEGLDPHAAGSLRSRQEIRATRAVLIAAIAVLLPQAGRSLPEALTAPLQDTAEALRQGYLAEAVAALSRAAPLAQGELAEALADLRQALAAWDGTPPAPGAAPLAPVLLHRDWIGAREAMLRAGGTLLAVGALWQLTGWSSGNLMLLGLSVMISLFSTFESPAQMMRWVFLGQCAGVAAMLICRWLVWPFATTEAQLVALMMPFILLGSLLVGHRRTGAISFDYNMVFLLLMQPHLPLSGSFGHSVMAALGVMSAPLVAWAMYALVYPANLKRRIDTLVRMIWRDLADLARDPAALTHRPVWRARLYHRTLRLVRMTERYGRAHDQAMELGLSALEAGQTIMRLHQRLAQPELTARERRHVALSLRRAAQIEQRPERAHAALRRAALRLNPPFPLTMQGVGS